MNTKNIAAFSLLVAITIILGQFSVPIGPMKFYFWEIPVVVALLLYGFKMGFSVAAVGIFAQAMIFPKAIGILFPVWNLVAMSTTLVAIFMAQWLITRKAPKSVHAKKWFSVVTLFVVAAMCIRLTVMPFVNYYVYKFMFPIFLGTSYTDAYLISLVPILLIFDTIVILYTVPTSYIIAKRINADLKIGNTLL